MIRIENLGATGMIDGLKSGFRNEGVNWHGNKLYYHSVDTGISYRAHELHPKMYWVVYPDGRLSKDFYNLSRVKQHCRDIAHELYPRSARSALQLAAE